MKEQEMSPATKATLTAWGFRLVTAAFLTLGGWTLNQTIGRLDAMEERATKLELWRAETQGDRFTSADGLAVWREISRLQEKIAANEPPAWLKDSLQRIEAKVDGLDERLRKVEARP